MTHNAYLSPKKNKWYDMGDKWQKNSSFGWEKDGLRGYVFGNEANTTLVLAIKGTSAAFLWMGDGETSANDKVNDNLLFSCCCARVDATWSPVCDCYMGSNMCNQTCVEQSLTGDSVYYNAAFKIFFNVADMYPQSSIWFTGHSLGGAVAGLVGLTFGIPTVTFEAPGELMAAKRLHLPMPPGIDMQDIPVWHFGHNADPIYTGSCTGAASSCYYAGYAMESKCHTGKSCSYDVISKYGWKSDVRLHRIEDVIEKVLKPWDNVTACEPDQDCVDCGLWKYVD
ncbi:alpha/beta-hydrolase [Basidiobolus meristosporus CBS 931.73]|uniref:triacylglycerol lipase n=1 Tax=Basidiobolus meristosporus CBS 931.73 TaxID=1314790 RepID=A0A1Y1XVX1_9FUNG|nr:alpha/beta-hydrolase [Basidiobolus meristosporus CBS 931.73]|eukprot:ORX89922.1 alpha/beta-hydrolase [Basidiobolus meristosporus CBS 931.73]